MLLPSQAADVSVDVTLACAFRVNVIDAVNAHDWAVCKMADLVSNAATAWQLFEHHVHIWQRNVLVDGKPGCPDLQGGAAPRSAKGTLRAFANCLLTLTCCCTVVAGRAGSLLS